MQITSIQDNTKPTTQDAKNNASSNSKPRIIYYHQTHYTNSQYVSILPVLRASTGVTHVIIAAFHLNSQPSRITLNDKPWNSPEFIPLWDEVRQLQAAGVKVLGMLGGAAQGSYMKLDGSLEGFHRWYQPLRAVVAAAGLDGLDLDIEEAMSLGGVVRLVDHLKTDFGQSFLVTLAPVRPALLNQQNLGGFSFDELEKGLGSRIAWYNVQFYCGWGDMGEPDGAEAIVARGWPPRKIVLGLVTNPANGDGWVEDDRLEACLRCLFAKYPDLGGVMGWEYFNSVTSAQPEVGSPWLWAEMINRILTSR